MKVEIIPAGNKTIARGASVNLAAQISEVIPARALAAITWTNQLNAVSGGTGNVCKPSTLAAGYGNATAVSEEVLLTDSYGALQCAAPNGLAQFGFAAPSHALRWAWQFNGNGTASVVGGGTVLLANQSCAAGTVARIVISNRVVSFYLGSTLVYQSSANAANECWYRAAVSISTPGLCVGDCRIEWAQQTPDVTRALNCVHWSATGGTLSQTAGLETTWVAPLAAGSYTITASAVGLDSASIVLSTSNITAVPVGATSGTLYEAVSNTVVELTANGGDAAALSADGGTVLDATHWLAPGVAGTYNLVYSAGGTTEAVAVQIQVVPALVINALDDSNIFDDCRAGTAHQFTSNIPGTTYELADASVVTSPLSSAGLFVAPNDADGATFGYHSYSVIARNGKQTVSFTIIVDPCYPTPVVGGPEPAKWLPVVPKYATRASENDQLCRQYAVLSSEPERRWQLDYQGLPLCDLTPADATIYCDINTTPPAPSRLPKHHYADRLDKFWTLVRGEGLPFWFCDRDGTWIKGVHFVSMTRDHSPTNYEGNQSRKVELVAAPCCTTMPLSEPC